MGDNEEKELTCEVVFICRRSKQLPCNHYKGMFDKRINREECESWNLKGHCCSHESKLEALKEVQAELEFWEKISSGEIKTASMMTPNELKECLNKKQEI